MRIWRMYSKTHGRWVQALIDEDVSSAGRTLTITYPVDDNGNFTDPENTWMKQTLYPADGSPVKFRSRRVDTDWSGWKNE